MKHDFSLYRLIFVGITIISTLGLLFSSIPAYSDCTNTCNTWHLSGATTIYYYTNLGDGDGEFPVTWIPSAIAGSHSSWNTNLYGTGVPITWNITSYPAQALITWSFEDLTGDDDYTFSNEIWGNTDINNCTEVLGANPVFNRNKSWRSQDGSNTWNGSGGYDVKTAAMHEIGHMYYLSHSDNTSNPSPIDIMNAGYILNNPSVNVSISSDDITSVEENYGVGNCSD